MRCKILVDWSSNWIKIVDKLNNIVVDDFDYEYEIHYKSVW